MQIRNKAEQRWRKCLLKEFVLRVKNHDYEYHYSKSKRKREIGKRSFEWIERMLCELIMYEGVKQKQLLGVCLKAVREQYTDNLTHRTIIGWFGDYKNNCKKR